MNKYITHNEQVCLNIMNLNMFNDLVPSGVPGGILICNFLVVSLISSADKKCVFIFFLTSRIYYNLSA